ncbi:MAG: threonine--tRNA ligase [Salibacteraceae bacterium]|nr:threonine--tRNA ligase [Salibacteraceae bacterium]|tara:strand:- start:17403 stop:19343 length:1941 start_codon:yes stop_codon:yes gene_type:complete
MIKITLPDGSVREFESGVTPFDVANDISSGLARNVLSASINGKTVESVTPIFEDAELVLHTWDNDEGKTAFWHSSAHILAQTLEDLYPGIKLTIGPAIENGFYYDVDTLDYVISEKDTAAIEKRFLDFAREKAQFKMRAVSKKDALELYNKQGNEFKVELISNLTDGDITFCDHSNFTDLCRGGHIPNTGFVKAIKILSIAGAYWRGDENKPQLSRVYAISFPKQKMLEEHLQMLEEAKKRDHRKLGKELELFTFSEKVGQGLPLWLPRGAELRSRLEDFLKKAQTKSGYQPVITPHIGHKSLYVTSGHYEKYGADSFQPIHTPKEDEEFLLKPMNCPHHCEIYKSKPRSYRDLPVRYAEFGTVYRYEQSGELHGLTRVRGFTQDDAHLFVRPDQLIEEFQNVIDLVSYVFTSLGFDDYEAQISLRDKEDHSKYIGSDENWEKSEDAILKAVEGKNLKTKIVYGEAAFYGPKLDFMVKDALGRKWQLGTIQVDYNLPERFELEYMGSDNQKHRPIMIHRAPFGSMERFIAILTEHCAGKFPLWLNPDQFAILTISDKYNEVAENMLLLLAQKGLRGYVDHRSEKIGKKIRDTELSKIPFMLIIGEKEAESGQISVRKQGEGDLGTFTIEAFAEIVDKEIKELVKEF